MKNQNQRKLRHSQRGVALITVLLVVALAAVIAMDMTERFRTQVRKTTAILALDAAKWVNIGAEGFAKNALKQDFEDSSDKTHLQQYWASGDVSFPLDDGSLFVGRLKDLHACFNLNGVREHKSEREALQQSGERPQALKQFIGLLEQLEIDNYQAEIMADSLSDWLDEDDYVNHSSGAEDSEYLGRRTPYLAANSLLVDKGELRAINGFNQPAVTALKPYVCVIPSETELKLNVNTVMQPQIFAGVFAPDLTLDQAQELIDERPADGYDSVGDFLKSSALAGIEVKDVVKKQLTVLSNNFLLESEVQLVDGTKLYSESTLKKKGDNWVVMSRRFGGRLERISDTKVSEPQ